MWCQSDHNQPDVTVAQFYYCIFYNFICHEISPHGLRTLLHKIPNFWKITFDFRSDRKWEPYQPELQTKKKQISLFYFISVQNSDKSIELRSVKLSTASKQVLYSYLLNPWTIGRFSTVQISLAVQRNLVWNSWQVT